MEISVVIPAKNEEDNVQPLIAEIISALDGVADYEIVFVDESMGFGVRFSFSRNYPEKINQLWFCFVLLGNPISLKAQREQARKELQKFNARRMGSRIRFSPRIH